MVLTQKTPLEDIIKNGQKYSTDMVKFCVDRKNRTVSVDEEMHIDMEYELVDNGSLDENIFGGDIIIDSIDPLKVHVIWEAHPNIERNRQLGTGRGRLITDQNVIDDLMSILTEWIY